MHRERSQGPGWATCFGSTRRWVRFPRLRLWPWCSGRCTRGRGPRGTGSIPVGHPSFGIGSVMLLGRQGDCRSLGGRFDSCTERQLGSEVMVTSRIPKPEDVVRFHAGRLARGRLAVQSLALQASALGVRLPTTPPHGVDLGRQRTRASSNGRTSGRHPDDGSSILFARSPGPRGPRDRGRWSSKPGGAGSNPAGGTLSSPGFEPGTWGFDSLRGHNVVTSPCGSIGKSGSLRSFRAQVRILPGRPRGSSNARSPGSFPGAIDEPGSIPGPATTLRSEVRTGPFIRASAGVRVSP